MNETEIAKVLGIAQAAVSKYLNGRYSKNVKRVAAAVRSGKFDKEIVKRIIAKRSASEISDIMEKIATDEGLVRVALEE